MIIRRKLRPLSAWLLLGLLLGCRAAPKGAQDLRGSPVQTHLRCRDLVTARLRPGRGRDQGDSRRVVGRLFLPGRQPPRRSARLAPVQPQGLFSSPALADLDGDSQPEILAGSEAGKLFAWHIDGRDVDGFPVDMGYRLWASPAVLEGPRIAIGGYERIHLLDARGRAVPEWPQPVRGWPDATAAYAPGLVAVTTLTPGDPSLGWLYAWSEDGGLVAGFPLELSLDSDPSPALARFDGDGRW